MKAKAFLLLSFCCFLASLGFLIGLFASKGVQAQVGVPHILGSPSKEMIVKFSEDFMREHGKQVKSTCFYVPDFQQWYLVDTVPPKKKYIVTEIMAEEPNCKLALAASSEGSALKLGVTPVDYASFRTGIAFEPNEPIYIATEDHAAVWVTLSGYFIDL